MNEDGNEVEVRLGDLAADAEKVSLPTGSALRSFSAQRKRRGRLGSWTAAIVILALVVAGFSIDRPAGPKGAPKANQNSTSTLPSAVTTVADLPGSTTVPSTIVQVIPADLLCHSSQLSLQLIPSGSYSEGPGQRTIRVMMMNQGNNKCELTGYPEIALFDA